MESRDRGSSRGATGSEPDSFEALYSSSPLPMWVYDRETLEFLAVNEASLAEYGFTREQFLGMRISDIRPDAEKTRLATDLSWPRPPLQWSGPWLHRRSDGSTLQVEIFSHEMTFAGHPAVLVTVYDTRRHGPVDEYRSGRRVLRRDNLTGLMDQVEFLTEVRELHDRGSSTCVLRIALDSFTNLNDALGYETGDRILTRIGRSLGQLPVPVVAAARVGGDEFALAAAVGDRSEALALAEQVAEVVRRNGPPDATVTATVGVAVESGAPGPVEAVLSEATIAVRWAKANRRGGIAVADEGFAQTAIEQLTIERELRNGIAIGELVVFFQPVIDLPEGRIAGSEALIRWRRPGHGLVPPGAFIPIAEQTGLIRDIWPVVLDQAVGRSARWRADTGQPMTVAVNLSARQFDDPTTVDRVVEALAAHSIDPSDLVVEVTETAAVEDPERMDEICSAFRLLGVRIALDDFGTGYSSLSYLERTPFDILKIDRLFIERIDTDRRQRQIVSGVVKLAHALGMTVVAEGVEEAGQLAQLVELGVEQAQGYHLGRPVDADAFTEMLAGDLRRR